MPSFETVKLFDLGHAPDDVIDAARTVAPAFAPDVGEHALWEIRVGECEWTGTAPRNEAEQRVAAQERRLHRWLTENGACRGETVLVKVDAP